MGERMAAARRVAARTRLTMGQSNSFTSGSIAEHPSAAVRRKGWPFLVLRWLLVLSQLSLIAGQGSQWDRQSASLQAALLSIIQQKGGGKGDNSWYCGVILVLSQLSLITGHETQ